MSLNINSKKITKAQQKTPSLRSPSGLSVDKTHPTFRINIEWYRRLFDAAKDGMVLLNGKTGRVIRVNKAFVEMAAQSARSLIGKALWEIAPLKNTDAALVAVRELQTRSNIYYDDIPFLRPDGSELSMEFTCTAHKTKSARIIQCVFRDISRRKLLENELENAEARFKALFRNAPVGIAFVNESGNIIENNSALEALLACRENELRGKHFSFFIHPADRQMDIQLFHEVVDGKKDFYRAACRHLRADGSTVWSLIVVSAIRGQNRRIRYLIRMVEDITERKHAEEVVIRSRDFYRRLLNELPNPIRLADTDGQCDYFNRAWLSFRGKKTEEELGNKWLKGIHHDDVERVRSLMAEALSTHIPFSAEYRLRRADGEYRWMAEFSSPFNDIDGKFAGYLSSCHDIHERKMLEQTLRSISTTDELTGILNRRGFFALAQQQIKISNRTNRGFLLVYGDLDGFKQINDIHGHQTGDQALIETAAVLREVFRESDIIARIGGDEFAVLMTEDKSASEASSVLGRLKEAIDARNKQSQEPYELSLSLGIERYDPEKPISLDRLISLADCKMYEEKKRKKIRRE